MISARWRAWVGIWVQTRPCRHASMHPSTHAFLRAPTCASTQTDRGTERASARARACFPPASVAWRTRRVRPARLPGAAGEEVPHHGRGARGRRSRGAAARRPTPKLSMPGFLGPGPDASNVFQRTYSASDTPFIMASTRSLELSLQDGFIICTIV